MDSGEDRVRQVESLLDRYGLDGEIIYHLNSPVLSLEDAMKVHGLAPGEVLKCLLLKSSDSKVIAVMAPGDVRIDLKKLERHANVKKLSFLSINEMKKRFSVEPGGIDPLTLSNMADLVFAERRLLDSEFVMGSAGSKYCGLKIRPYELIEALNIAVLDIAKF
jgi:prolyl-tRNA editing enzyme YbaK/EbsC (Cys-tRNA(Pro) deacylase)